MADTVNNSGETDHLFKPGESGNPKGRPVGAKNKITADLRRLFLDVADKLHPDGAEEALLEWAKNPRNQGKYWELIARMLPKTVDVSIDEPDKKEQLDELARAEARAGNGFGEGE